MNVTLALVTAQVCGYVCNGAHRESEGQPRHSFAGALNERINDNTANKSNSALQVSSCSPADAQLRPSALQWSVHLGLLRACVSVPSVFYAHFIDPYSCF